MGNKITFTSGTIWYNGEPFSCTDYKVIEFSELNATYDDIEVLPELQNVRATMEGSFTCECKLNFRSRVRIFGFWNVIKADIKRIFKHKKER